MFTARYVLPTVYLCVLCGSEKKQRYNTSVITVNKHIAVFWGVTQVRRFGERHYSCLQR